MLLLMLYLKNSGYFIGISAHKKKCDAEKTKVYVDNLSKTIRNIRTSSIKKKIVCFEQNGKDLQLLMDVKTRWYSLIKIRFLQIKELLNKTLHELGQQIIAESDILVLEEHAIPCHHWKLQ